MRRFEDKVILITGASRGIGKTTAERFADEGAKLALISNDSIDLHQTFGELNSRGNTVLPLLADVSHFDAVNAAVDQTVQRFGKIDVLINNAGIAWEEDFVSITEANWKKIIDVNLNGMFYVSQAVSKHMVRQGTGVIVNMSSTNGLVGEAKYAHYNASKGGVMLLTKTMAIELGAYGIRVNAVCPGYIQTPMSESIDSPEFMAEYVRHKIPIGRVGKPRDVAGVFAFLASDDAAFITGESIVVDGGQLSF